MRKCFLLLTLLTAGCGGSGKAGALVEEEIQETNKLTKIFKGVKDVNSFDYAVAAMEQPCTTIAHLRKQREELLSKMTPAQMKSYDALPEVKTLNDARGKMEQSLMDARRFMPTRLHEIDEVWTKAGLGQIR